MEATPHPIAALFPALVKSEYQELLEDIRENGQRDPITLWQYDADHIWIVDGCTRHKICQELGIAVRSERKMFEDEAAVFRFVISKNMRRRQLDQSQRSILAAKLAKYYEKNIADANLQKGSKTEALKSAAKAQGVSPRSAAGAKALTVHGCQELQDMVSDGKIKVSPAEVVARELSTAEQRELVEAGPKAIKKKAAEIRERKKAEAAEKKAVKAKQEADAQTTSEPSALDRAQPDAPVEINRNGRSITIGADREPGHDVLPDPPVEEAVEPIEETIVELDEKRCAGPACGHGVDLDCHIRADDSYFCSLSCLLGSVAAGVKFSDISIQCDGSTKAFLSALDIGLDDAADVARFLNGLYVD